MYTSVQRWGNSNAVRIPKSILEAAKITENERVEIVAQDREIVIKPAKRKYQTLADLFDGYEGGYDFGELEFGVRGREIL